MRTIATPAPDHRPRPELAVPLPEVTFVVIDLETTGCDAGVDRIIEVAAARFRGGECLGTFQTLVNPGCGIPTAVVRLTGITEPMVAPAPTIEEILPSFLQFVGDAVLVGHNLRFDTSFLDAVLVANGLAQLAQARVDTLRLARRLLAGELPSFRLALLADFFHTTVRPVHRALDDVLATVEVLHGLLERAAGYGASALDDLLALPADPLALAKMPLALDLPRRPGVYLFRGADGRVIFVGGADNLRVRVCAHLANAGGRRSPLLRCLAAIEHVVCSSALEAAVLEFRLAHLHRAKPGRRCGSSRRSSRRRGRPASGPGHPDLGPATSARPRSPRHGRARGPWL